MQYRKGDTVVITGPSKTYTTHENAFAEFGFKYKLFNPPFRKYEEGTVFNTGIVNGDTETVSVRHKDGRECLIGVDGVSLKTNNMDNLTITKEKVLQAAEKCPQAKETLKTLFPEVFERYTLKSMAAGKGMRLFDGMASGDNTMIGVHGWDESKTDRFHLSHHFEWKIENNKLIPTPKI